MREILRAGGAEPRLPLWTRVVEDSLQAADFIPAIEARQGRKVACLEEIARGMGYITRADALWSADSMHRTGHGQYLLHLLEQKV